MHGAEPATLDEQFIRALEQLAPPPAPNQRDGINRAALAVLRRGLGQPPGAVPEMFQYVRELARFNNPVRERDAFLVASLFGWHPKAWPATADDGRRTSVRWTQNFGNSVARLVLELNRRQWGRAPSASKEGVATAIDAQDEQPSKGRAQQQPGIERRFVALLAADREDLGDHLRALMGLLRQHEVPVDWLQLLRDLGSWDSADRDVQRHWARSFWGSSEVDQQPA